ncbi:MAG TPA: hypothetical protein VF077_01535 [Nitrospiraceae bacterium]
MNIPDRRPGDPGYVAPLDDKVRSLTNDIGRGRDTDRLALRKLDRVAAPWHREHRYTTTETIEIECKSGAVIRIQSDVMGGVDVNVSRTGIDGNTERMEVAHIYFSDEFANPALVNIHHFNMEANDESDG